MATYSGFKIFIESLPKTYDLCPFYDLVSPKCSILAAFWTSFNRPQYYGRWFKLLVGLGIVDKRSNGSMEYVI